MTIKKLIESDRHLYVVGTARDGEDAIEKARTLKPDVITMDINMPGLDGLSALQIIVHEEIAPVIMVSSLTQEGAVTTFEALELGAFDYVGKPGGTVSSDMSNHSQGIVGKNKGCRRLRSQVKAGKKNAYAKAGKQKNHPSKTQEGSQKTIEAVRYRFCSHRYRHLNGRTENHIRSVTLFTG